MTYWHHFVERFFSHRGVFRLSLPVTGNDPSGEEHGADKQYEIVQPALARYFHTHFQSGISQIQLTFERGTIDRQLSNGCHFLENPKASLIYWFANSHVSICTLSKGPHCSLLLTDAYGSGGCHGAAEGTVRQ